MLSQSMPEVKARYTDNLGEDMDAESYQNTDGTKWIMHRGAASSISARSQVHEVKSTYYEKFMEDIDAEHHVVDDGASWVVHRGAASSI